MSSLNTLHFYATPEHPCSYLKEKKATTVFADPRAYIPLSLYTQLSQMGFRRSGSHYYRPQCQQCNACKPVRINLSHFKLSRSQRRIINRCKHITTNIDCPTYHEDTYNLYERYISQRHADGDMFPPDRDQYQNFLLDSHECTRFVHFHEGAQLIAVAVTDYLNDGLSAVYTFFEPDYAERSLGTYAILWQIQEAISHKLPYLYLGYWIAQCPKMSYKIRFSGLEYYDGINWQPLTLE